MTEPTYGKPCMSNLPPELGRRVIHHITDSELPDRELLRRKSSELLNEMIAERKRENARNRGQSTI